MNKEGGQEESTGKRRTECFTRICLFLWEWGQRVRGSTAGGLLEFWGRDCGTGFGGKEGEVNICSYPTCFSGGVVCWFLGYAFYWCWNKTMSGTGKYLYAT